MLYAVILAAGVGKRMKTKTKKQYIKINNKPIIEYSIDKFLKIKKIDKIIIVINESDKKNHSVLEILKKYNCEIVDLHKFYKKNNECILRQERKSNKYIHNNNFSLQNCKKYGNDFGNMLNNEDTILKEFLNIFIDKGSTLKNKIQVIYGGKERYYSVNNAINFIKNIYGIKKDDEIIIHDSARPNVDVDDVKKLISLIKKYKAITLGSHLVDTIKQIKNNKNDVKEVVKTENRNNFYLIKTPQGFNLNLLDKCYEKFINVTEKYNITDDLQIVELFSNKKTYILDSNKYNYKITTKDDLCLLHNTMHHKK